MEITISMKEPQSPQVVASLLRKYADAMWTLEPKTNTEALDDDAEFPTPPQTKKAAKKTEVDETFSLEDEAPVAKKTVTREEVVAALNSYKERTSVAKAVALLAKFKVKSLRDVDPSDYPKLYKLTQA